MSDSTENSDDATERARLDQQAFDRLPLAVQLATRLKQERSVASQTAYVQRRKDLAKKTAMIGVAILLLPHLPVLGPIGLVLITIQGAASGYLLVEKEFGRLRGILLFGGGAAAFDLISFVMGLLKPGEMGYLILAWIMMISGGLLLAIWVQKQREKTEMY